MRRCQGSQEVGNWQLFVVAFVKKRSLIKYIYTFGCEDESNLDS